MNDGTVRKRIIIGFSAVIPLMAGLCVLAYVELRGISSQATALRGDSVSGLYLIGRLQAGSIVAYNALERLVSEPDPARMQAMLAAVQEKSTEQLEQIRQYEVTAITARGNELLAAVKAALASLTVVCGEVIRLGEDSRTKAEATALTHRIKGLAPGTRTSNRKQQREAVRDPTRC
jgi:hypothetical protein